MLLSCVCLFVTTPTALHLPLLISILKCLYPLLLIISCSHQVNAAAHPRYVFCPGRHLGEPRAVFQVHVGSPSPHPSLDLHPPLLHFHFTAVSLLLFFNQLLVLLGSSASSTPPFNLLCVYMCGSVSLCLRVGVTVR